MSFTPCHPAISRRHAASRANNHEATRIIAIFADAASRQPLFHHGQRHVTTIVAETTAAAAETSRANGRLRVYYYFRHHTPA